MPVFENEQELVELRAIDFEFFARNFVADVAALAIVGDFERLERDFLRIHFIVAAATWSDADTAARIFPAIASRWPMTYFVRFFRFFCVSARFRFGLLHFLAVFVDVEKRNSANANLQQTLHILSR